MEVMMRERSSLALYNSSWNNCEEICTELCTEEATREILWWKYGFLATGGFGGTVSGEFISREAKGKIVSNNCDMTSESRNSNEKSRSPFSRQRFGKHIYRVKQSNTGSTVA
jgi:hypothetical protein